MSIPAIAASIPAAPLNPKAHGKLSDRTVTAILIFGGTTSLVMLVASVALLQLSLLVGGFAMLGFTSLAAIFAYRHNIHVLYKEVIVLREQVNELKENQITPATLMERLGVLEKEFLNRGRYKYIDETPGPDDVPLPSSAASSSSSPPLSSASLPV